MCCLAVTTPAQNQTSRYVYDDDGRLRAVIAPNGAAAVYEYDSAGNFTAIRRLNADDLEVLVFSPRSGIVGTQVTFYGVGFGAGVSSVTFAGGAAGTLVNFTNNTITAIVPAGAVTGPITIATARGQLTTVTPFIVQGIALTPAEASIVDGESIQFSATVIVPGDQQEVIWSVNGLEGGNAVSGRITSAGFFTAPPDPPASFDVSIQATSVVFPEISGQAIVHVRSLADFRFTISNGISIGKGLAFSNMSALSAGVSIGKGVNYETAGALSSAVSVGKGPGFSDAVVSGGISLTIGPIISGIAPNSIARNSNANLTLNGSNFIDTTTVHLFNLDGSITNGVAVSNIVVSGNGNSLTLNLIVDAGAQTGRKIMVVATPTGHSVRSDVTVNTLQIN